MVDIKRRQNPRATSNAISSILLLYMIPVFYQSFKKDLTENDLFEPLDEHRSSFLGEKLEAAWKRYHKKYKKFCLHFALIRVFRYDLFMLGVMGLTKELIAVICLPYFIGKLVELYTQPLDVIDNISPQMGYYYTAALMVSLVIERLISHPMFMWSMHLGMKIRVACNGLIYRKMLRMSKQAAAQTTAGHVVNLASNDVGKFDIVTPHMHYAWVAPIQAMVGLFFLYLQIDMASLIGMAFLLLLVPLQTLIAKQTMVLRLRAALTTDERIRLMNEIISGIQVIKMYVWEKSFAKLVAQVRSKELQAIRSSKYLRALTYAMETVGTRVAIFVSLVGYSLLGNQVTARTAFQVTAMFNVIKTPFTFLFSMGLSGMAEVNVSLLRINTYLDHDETPLKLTQLAIKQTQNVVNHKQTNPQIILQKVVASWNNETTDNTLCDISLAIDKPQLFAVIGPVGCGKSSLLNVLLKELIPKSGMAEINGRVSYCAQEPWLFSGSIRDNILFGDDYDEQRYRKICKVCALESDLAQLPHRDKTLVGERGRALSGGQKARINLARSIYKQADIYLLDDPLSAVDAHVGERLFKNCIKSFLRDKIVVLVTHQLQYLMDADEILILKDGSIAAMGDYQTVLSKGVDVVEIIEGSEATEATENEVTMVTATARKRLSSIKSENNEEIWDAHENNADVPMLEKETVTAGKVTVSTYKRFFKIGGSGFLMFIVFASYITSEVVSRIGDYFVAYWVEKEEEFSVSKLQRNESNYRIYDSNSTDADARSISSERNMLIYEYSGITLLVVILSVFCNILAFYYLLRASGNLHNTIFEQLTRAKLYFFNTNPVGRILNKFSMDIGIIDDLLPVCTVEVAKTAMLLFGTLVLTSIVNVMLVPAAFALLVLFYLMRIVYVGTSRNIKRIEAIARSPVYNQMTTTMNGLSTIRVFDGEQKATQKYDTFQDLHSSAWFLYVSATRAFGCWLDLLCVFFLGIVTVCVLAFDQDKQGTSLGLIITQYMGLMGALQWGMRQWSEMENLMTSVERVLEYTHLDNEPVREGKAILPTNWPDEGKLEFQKVSMRYVQNDEPVLKNLNFVIQPGEKVGIVGRTGAGKSSIINALYQLYDLEGAIFIDNVDTTEQNLALVRSKISIIPQDSLLFCGTLRKNLDPFDEYNDDELWSALEQVELKALIAEMPHGLHTNIAEDGSNYSVGQRQLICLARAIIRKNQILVLDEVTANVDRETDALIQSAIRHHFSKCTVLTIAHRLNSIIDSDKILVMDAGEVAEFDTVFNLLHKQDGIFKNMVETSGMNVDEILANVSE